MCFQDFVLMLYDRPGLTRPLSGMARKRAMTPAFSTGVSFTALVLPEGRESDMLVVIILNKSNLYLIKIMAFP